MIMALNRLLKKSAGASGIPAAYSGRVRSGVAMVGIAALGLSLPSAQPMRRIRPRRRPARSCSARWTPSLGTVAAEAGSSDVSVAMFEFDWASFEPSPGVFSSSYPATMESYLQAYQAAGMKVTLGLGLEDPPSWVFSLPDATYVNQYGDQSNEANFVFSAAVRQAAAGYLTQIASDIPLSNFWAIRLTSGGDPEMLYPGGGAYWAFDNAALTGNGLAAGMTAQPRPELDPRQPRPEPGPDRRVGQLVRRRPRRRDQLADADPARPGLQRLLRDRHPRLRHPPGRPGLEEMFNLPNDGTTGMGAVWDRYYAMLPDKTNVIAYISSVADNSGGNDDCRPGDSSIPLTSPAMDSWSATRWISAIAHQNGLLVGGENPGYGIPVSLDFDYLNTSSSGMMADAVGQAQSCGFQVFYWAHDVHLWDGTLPFSMYAGSIAADAARPTTSRWRAASRPAARRADSRPATATTTTSVPTGRQPNPAPPSPFSSPSRARLTACCWNCRRTGPPASETIEVDGSADGNNWTTLAPATAYNFTTAATPSESGVPAGPRTTSASTSAETPSWASPRSPSSRPTPTKPTRKSPGGPATRWPTRALLALRAYRPGIYWAAASASATAASPAPNDSME